MSENERIHSSNFTSSRPPSPFKTKTKKLSPRACPPLSFSHSLLRALVLVSKALAPPPTPSQLACQSAYECRLKPSRRRQTELCWGFGHHNNTTTHTQSRGGRGSSGRFLAEGNKSLTHTHAAQLGCSGVSLLTYFFTVIQRQTPGTLALNVNSATKAGVHMR